MAIEANPPLPRRVRQFRLIAAGAVVGIVGALVACVYPAIRKARDAAHSSATT